MKLLSNDARALNEKIQAAVRQATTDHLAEVEKTYQENRKADRKARGKKFRRGQNGWLEHYPLSVHHYSVQNGRECEVSLDGCPYSVRVMQNQPMYDWGGRKLKDASWSLNVHHSGGKSIGEARTVTDIRGTNYEGLVQHAMVMVLTYAYVEGVPTT